MVERLGRVILRRHYLLEVMLAAYPLSLRHIEMMMIERGVFVDHSTVHRWALKILPVLVLVFRRRKTPGRHELASWRMDETYVKVCSQWKYLYRAVDREGDTVDFLLSTHRDEAAARRFLERAIDLHGVPEKITIDKGGANTAAIVSVQADSGLPIELRQSKYLNNIVEQDHRAVKPIVRPMPGFKSMRSARILIAGIETMHRIHKGQLKRLKDHASAAADQFYSLAF
ncbi:MAG: IS6 family transposase [Betaproteobacteria bacterium]|nr:IS6 family transposase [Betaproteobacteria bacterium]